MRTIAPGSWRSGCFEGVSRSHVSLLLLIVFFVQLFLGCNAPQVVSGTQLSGNDPAVPFRLLDQFGQQKTLEDYEGKVILLTFLYTSCPDICPVVARHLKTVHKALGDRDGEVALVMITVDPDRDSMERAYEYSRHWGMLNHWDFLVGEKHVLEPIWKAYYLAPPEHSDYQGGGSGSEGPYVSEDGSIGALGGKISEQYIVSHLAPVYVIGRQGYLRMLFTPPFDPEDLTKYVVSILGPK